MPIRHLVLTSAGCPKTLCSKFNVNLLTCVVCLSEMCISIRLLAENEFILIKSVCEAVLILLRVAMIVNEVS